MSTAVCFLAIATTDVVHDSTSSVSDNDVILPSLDQPGVPQLITSRSHMGNLLDQLDTSIQLRRIAMEAEQVCLLCTHKYKQNF